MSWRLNSPKFLKGYWPLNGHAEDVAGVNHGTWSGTELYLDGPYNKQVADLDGASGITVTDPYPSALTEMSFSMVTKTDTISAISYVLGHTGNVFDSRVNVGGQLQIYSTGLGAWTNIRAVTVDEWVHVVYVYNGVWNIYVNADLEYTSGSVGESIDGNLYFGKNVAGSAFMNGKLFNIRKFNCALTQDEIIKLMAMDRRI